MLLQLLICRRSGGHLCGLYCQGVANLQYPNSLCYNGVVGFVSLWWYMCHLCILWVCTNSCRQTRLDNMSCSLGVERSILVLNCGLFSTLLDLWHGLGGCLLSFRVPLLICYRLMVWAIKPLWCWFETFNCLRASWGFLGFVCLFVCMVLCTCTTIGSRPSIAALILQSSYFDPVVWSSDMIALDLDLIL